MLENGQFKRSAAAFILLLCGLGLEGCVERKITIVSDPPGALVAVNDVEMGRTPVTFPFLWYGNYDVRLNLDQHAGPDQKGPLKTYYLHTSQRASAPPYQWLGVDLFAEILPIPFKDEHIWAFALPEVVSGSDEELVQRAKELQGRLEVPVPLKDAPKNASNPPTTGPAASRP